MLTSHSPFIRCVNLLPPPDNVLFLRTAHAIYEYHKFTEALRVAIRLGDPELIHDEHGGVSRIEFVMGY